jgi:CRP-like cAMP-binding protein
MFQELIESHYGKNDYIFREGDPTEYFHIVKEGTVRCVTSAPEGKECTLKMLMPGCFFCCDAAVFDGTCIKARPNRWEMSASSGCARKPTSRCCDGAQMPLLK